MMWHSNNENSGFCQKPLPAAPRSGGIHTTSYLEVGKGNNSRAPISTLEKLSMKKTLIALAAVAVSSAAMAQVTMSGAVSFGYANDTTATGTKTSGFGTDTAKIAFGASEDLGGGLKVNASMFIDNLVEGSTANGGNVVLGVTGGFGSVQFSSAESGDFLPVDGLTANSNGTDADRIAYTLPSFVQGLTLVVQAQDGTAIGGDTSGNGVTLIAANYTSGPLSVDVLRADFSIDSINTRTGVKVGYDLGVAKVSYGTLKHDTVDAAKDVTETGLTISAPVGPLSVAYNRATSKTGTAAKLNGSSLSVSYALSKRTSVSFYSEAYEAAKGDTSKVKEQSLLLNHSF